MTAHTIRRALAPLCLAVFCATALAAAGVSAPSRAVGGPPTTPKKPVTDTYHGVQVVDDYRWLEDWNDPAVKAWSEAQNAHARSVLDGLPAVAVVRERLTALMTGTGVEYTHLQHRGGAFFAIRHDPAFQQPTLVTFPSLREGRDFPGQVVRDHERTLVDPNARDQSGLTTIDWYEASPDGKLVAVSLSEAGSESGTLRVFSVVTGKETGDVIPRAHGGTAGGSLAWRAENTGFYYTRYPRAGERPDADLDFYVQVYSHTIGEDPAKDTYEVGKEFPRIAEIVLEADDRGRVLASVQNGDGGEFEHHLKMPGVEGWTRLSKFEDRLVCGVLGPENRVLFVSRKGAPRGKVVECALIFKVVEENGVKKLGPLAPQFNDLIPVSTDGASIETDFFGKVGLLSTGPYLYVWYQNGGPNEVRVFNLALVGSAWSKLVGTLPGEPVSTFGQLLPVGDELYYQNESYLKPAAWLAQDLGQTGLSPRLILAQRSPADFSDCEVVREFATSKDGTKVPVNIIRLKNLGMSLENGLTPNDGSPRTLTANQPATPAEPGKPGQPGWRLPAPTILYGYGGYGVNETPGFSPRRRLWLENGGVFAIANIRGGGEYGEEWHLGGNLTRKQNVFDDFQAAAELLIQHGYTNRENLAIMGGSNGGLLMGATLTQRPDLCRAVVSMVGIYDMLRVELSANGAFNITEFGTVKNKAQFEALYAYSPYHRVRDGVAYPSILFTTGANDPRVDPMQSRKMTARLQAASPGTITLLRTSASAGHGSGSSLSQRIEQGTDIYAFLMKELGVTPVAAPGAPGGPGSK
jgi:prolyl oligopeptidase